MSEISYINNLINNAKYFFKQSNTHKDIEDSIRNGFIEFAGILEDTGRQPSENSSSIKYCNLYKLNTHYMNQNLQGGGFHDEYMSSITICLLTFLKTIKGEENRKEKIIKYLNNLLDLNLEESLYDYPNNEKIYEY
jgi:hypothetical protein